MMNSYIIFYRLIVQLIFKCPFRLEWFKIKIYNELIENKTEDVIGYTFIVTLSNINERIKEFRNYNNIDSDKWIMTSTKYIPFLTIILKKEILGKIKTPFMVLIGKHILFSLS